ncbi:MAG: hypothetical protein ABIJ37_08345 [Pseudomonadota bacterium]
MKNFLFRSLEQGISQDKLPVFELFYGTAAKGDKNVLPVSRGFSEFGEIEAKCR